MRRCDAFPELNTMPLSSRTSSPTVPLAGSSHRYPANLAHKPWKSPDHGILRRNNTLRTIPHVDEATRLQPRLAPACAHVLQRQNTTPRVYPAPIVQVDTRKAVVGIVHRCSPIYTKQLHAATPVGSEPLKRRAEL